MVKFGYGDIVCSICNYGIGIKTNIHRNSENWENKIHSGECEHFKYWINILTRKKLKLKDTKGKKVFINGIDEIKQELVANCKKCNDKITFNTCCRNMNTDSGNEIKECKTCGNKVNFKYNYTTNYVPSYKELDSYYLPNLTRISYQYRK